MDYYYIDFPKIGYQIFKNKMAQAMEIYESFMEKNPVILKINRTNLSNNGTIINLTIINNNITEKVYKNASDIQQNPEKNTDSPFKVNSTEFYENSVQNFSESNIVTQSHTNYSLPVFETSKENKTTSSYQANNTANVEDNKTATNEANKTVSNGGNKTVSNEANKTTIDGTKKPEVAPVGFFGHVSNTVTNIFHSLTSWF